MRTDFYVYQLRRADSKLPFYIGKGRGDRLFDHFRKSSLAKRNFKNNYFKKAANDNVEVLAEMIVTDLLETSAFEIEIALISFYGRRCDGTGVLTNLSAGGEGPSGVKFTFTEQHKNNLKVAASQQELQQCPHCDCLCKPAHFKRYHGKNCANLTQKGWSNPSIAGSRNVRAKLNEMDIIEIRRLVSTGMSKAAVGRLYNTTDSNICKIILRQSWAHVY